MIVDVTCPHCQTVNPITMVLNVDSNPFELIHCRGCHVPFCCSVNLRPDVATYTLEMVRSEPEPTEQVDEPAPVVQIPESPEFQEMAGAPVETTLHVEQEDPAVEQSVPEEPEAAEEVEHEPTAVEQWEQLPNSKNVTYLLKDDAVSLKYNGYSEETYGLDVIYTLQDMDFPERRGEIKDMLRDTTCRDSKKSALFHFLSAVDQDEVSL